MSDQTLRTRILGHNGMAPRYTSYPPAPVFENGYSPVHLENWMSGLKKPQNLSLYVHIPFCSRLCYYCGCHTSIANQYERIAAYLTSLHREIDLTATKLSDSVPVTHLHFGGGSPTMLTDADFLGLMDHLRQAFSIDAQAEIAIEADPRHLTQPKMAHYAHNRVTRISLGVQDFNDTVLRAVNREQPYALTQDAVRWARDLGIRGVNMDVMYGLPHQTVSSMTDTLEKIVALSPDRVSFFGYAHVPWMKKHMTVIGENFLPDPGLRYDLFEMGKSILIRDGYHAIGIDHFVKESDPMYAIWRSGRLRRNFQGYTTDQAEALLGLGASSISSFPQGYSQNYTDLRAYADAINTGRLPVARGIEKTPEDHVRGDVIMRIMCDLYVDLAQVAQQHDLPITHFDSACDRLASLSAGGLAQLDGRRLTINPQAPQIVRTIAQVFDAYQPVNQNTPRHSRAI